ncbi:MAG: hypothetical protein WCC17_03355 [Candidatus Nitrosopolaris sp.]
MRSNREYIQTKICEIDNADLIYDIKEKCDKEFVEKYNKSVVDSMDCSIKKLEVEMTRQNTISGKNTMNFCHCLRNS